MFYSSEGLYVKVSRKFKSKIFQDAAVLPGLTCVTLWSQKHLLFFYHQAQKLWRSNINEFSQSFWHYKSRIKELKSTKFLVPGVKSFLEYQKVQFLDHSFDIYLTWSVWLEKLIFVVLQTIWLFMSAILT